MQASFRRTSRWERILLALLAAYLILWPLEAGWSAVFSIRTVIQLAIYALGSVVLGRILLRLARWLTRRLLWRVRHRMAAVYVFIGVIPLALAFLLSGLGLFLVFGPLGAFMVSNEVDKRAEALYATADSLFWQLRSLSPDERRAAGAKFLDDARQRYPDLLVRFETPNGPIAIPEFLRDDGPPDTVESYRGVVRRRGAYYLAAYTPSLLLMVPLTEEYLLEWLPGFGVVSPIGGFVAARPDGPPPSLQTAASGAGATALQLPAGFVGPRRGRQLQQLPLQMRLPEPRYALDWSIPWRAETPVLDWATGETRREEVFELTTRFSALLTLLFRSQSEGTTRMATTLGYALWSLFGFALVVSTVVAVSLTRTITSAINELYIGARHVSRGDFSYRTPVRGHTQLTELARSFNSMTTSIERLVEDSRERQKLESELAIANEMQRQLFPKQRPQLAGIDTLGVCKPAKVVSGDFYDYLDIDDHRVAIAFGDVAGKGISSALVMASAHSTIRTLLGRLRGADDLAAAVVDIVTETNRQLFDGTAPELFTTLFFGVYSNLNAELVYVNAGHLPPLLIRDGQRIPLEVTGLVIGAFPGIQYESRTVNLEVGDLLAAFTDGITEPENPYGEEFGEDRLWRILQREHDRPIDDIIATVLEEVSAWVGGPVQQDDMTMLLLRRQA
jgi:sigma-B regulation protein RsbU (phosphoserine phosphatase)